MILWNASIFDFSSTFSEQHITVLVQNIVGDKQHLEIEGKIDVLWKEPHIQINVMKRQKTLRLAEELTQTFIFRFYYFLAKRTVDVEQEEISTHCVIYYSPFSQWSLCVARSPD